jgi:hypothetical protein
MASQKPEADSSNPTAIEEKNPKFAALKAHLP